MIEHIPLPCSGDDQRRDSDARSAVATRSPGLARCDNETHQITSRIVSPRRAMSRKLDTHRSTEHVARIGESAHRSEHGASRGGDEEARRDRGRRDRSHHAGQTLVYIVRFRRFIDDSMFATPPRRDTTNDDERRTTTTGRQGDERARRRGAREGAHDHQRQRRCVTLRRRRVSVSVARVVWRCGSRICVRFARFLFRSCCDRRHRQIDNRYDNRRRSRRRGGRGARARQARGRAATRRRPARRTPRRSSIVVGSDR